MIKNYGLNLEKELADQSEKDWMFGAVDVTDIAPIPENERERYLPQGEVQKSDKEDMMDCASRGPNNILEAKLNYLIERKLLSFGNEMWLKQNGYVTDKGVELSDAFTAIKAGTTRQGNSLKAPLEAMRTCGFIPKSKLPLEKWMTWEDYHNPQRITVEMDELGLEFVRRIPINYLKVLVADFPQVQKEDFIDVAGYAWPIPINGIYPKISYPPNHVWVNFRNRTFAFDNYIDSVDGDFIKHLATDYEFYSHGYRVVINEVRNSTVNKESWWERFYGVCLRCFRW